MNKINILLILALLIFAGCAESVRQDELIIGRPAAATDKVVTFDTGDGASNVQITAQDADQEIDISAAAATEATGNMMIDAYTRAVGTSVGVRGVATSADSGFYTIANPVSAAITNLSVTLVTSGRPVIIAVMNDPDSGSGGGFFECGVPSGSTGEFSLKLNDGTDSNKEYTFRTENDSAGIAQIFIPFSSASWIDYPSAGSTTYTLSVTGVSCNPFDATHAILIAYEL